WAAVWDYFGIEPATPYEAVLADRDMPGARWFPGATLNYAGHLVQGARRTGHPDGASIVSYSQTRATVRLTPADLEDLVARARAGFVELGVGRGDRVAAYLPSLPETVAAYLACLSLGAIWSSCAPEFGTRSVVDRLAQTKPKVLLAIDGYRFVNKPVDRLAEVAEIRTALPSLQSVVALPYLYADDVRIDGAVGWSDFTAVTGPLTFDPVPFDHPLHILFSSGTTGLPKPIVHGHGGVLLDQLKSMAFHQDLGPDDRMFFFTTTGWMAWNWLVSALGLGTSIVLLDGNLLHQPRLPQRLSQGGRRAQGGGRPVEATDRLFRGLTAQRRALPLGLRRRRRRGLPPLLQRGHRDLRRLRRRRARAGRGDHLPLARMRRRGLRRARPPGRRPRRRARARRTAPVDASRPVERPGRAPVPGHLLRPVPGGLAPRRPDHDLGSRRPRHQRPVRRHSQPGRCPARHQRVLRGRGGPTRDQRQPRRPPRRPRRRRRAADPLRRPRRGHRARRAPAGPHHGRSPP